MGRSPQGGCTRSCRTLSTARDWGPSRSRCLSERMPNSPLLPAGPLNALGILAKDRALYEDAGIYYDLALGLVTSHAGTDAPELAGLYHNLAGLAHVQGQFAQAEEPARRAVRLRRADSSPDTAGLAADLSVLGAVLAGQERFDDAAAILSEALALWRSRYGNSHIRGRRPASQSRGNPAVPARLFIG